MHEQTFTAVAPSAPATRLGALRLLDLPHLVFAVFFFWLFWIELNDPDYFWHLKAGEYIVSHMALPSGDPFSYTFQGKPWALHEWLFEAVLYGVFSLLGSTGVKLLTALLGSIATYIAYRAANRLLGASTLALALTIPCLLIQACGFITPRPQLVTFVLFAVLVHLLVAFKYFADDRRLWLIPPLLVLWVNMHGGYVIGIALLALFCACEWLMHWTGYADAAYRRRLVKLSSIAALGALATVINPDGIGAWLFPLQVMNMDFALSVISEWQSPNFRELYGKLFLVLAFGFFLANIYRRTKPDLTEIALPVFFLFAGFVSLRHIPHATFLLVPFVAVALRDSPVQRLYARLTRSGTQLGNIEYVLNWVLLVVVGLTFYLMNPILQANAQTRLNEAMPVKAVEFVKSHGITGRMLNEYAQGGYLIYHLYPQQQVFIDGRADVYGDEFIKEFIKIRQGAPGWDKAFNKFAIDYLITRRDAPIRERLLSRGDFKMVYDDDAHSVLVRKLPRFEQLAEQKAE